MKHSITHHNAGMGKSFSMPDVTMPKKVSIPAPKKGSHNPVPAAKTGQS